MRRREFITLVGGAAAWPMRARAQQAGAVRRLAVLMSTAEADLEEISSVKVFVAGLARLGWTTDKNLKIEYWWAAGDSERMIANARAAVASRPDVMLVKGANVPAASQATATVPIVFVVLSDAVADRYVGSFARPNANITGFTSYERGLVGKRLALLRQIAPATRRVLYIRSGRIGTDTDALLQSLITDARPLGLPVVDGKSDDAADIGRHVEDFARQGGGGLIAAFDAFVTVHRQQLVELAARHKLPAIYPLPAFIQSGGLLSYGFDQDDQFGQAASYVARILSGETIGDLPVQTPTKFKMVVNQKTAKALGLTVPAEMLALADDVIQ